MDPSSVEEEHEKVPSRVTTRAQTEKERLKTVRSMLENVDTAELFFAKRRSQEKQLDVENSSKEVEDKTVILESTRNYDDSTKEKPQLIVNAQEDLAKSQKNSLIEHENFFNELHVEKLLCFDISSLCSLYESINNN
jgi:hypothetical protein